MDISEIVNRIAPKVRDGLLRTHTRTAVCLYSRFSFCFVPLQHGRPEVAEPTLQRWIGDSAAIPCTPDVQAPKPKKKSPRWAHYTNLFPLNIKSALKTKRTWMNSNIYRYVISVEKIMMCLNFYVFNAFYSRALIRFVTFHYSGYSRYAPWCLTRSLSKSVQSKAETCLLFRKGSIAIFIFFC